MHKKKHILYLVTINMLKILEPSSIDYRVKLFILKLMLEGTMYAPEYITIRTRIVVCYQIRQNN